MQNHDPKDREGEYFHHGRLLNKTDTSDVSGEKNSIVLCCRMKGIPCEDLTGEHIDEITILFTANNKTNQK